MCDNLNKYQKWLFSQSDLDKFQKYKKNIEQSIDIYIEKIKKVCEYSVLIIKHHNEPYEISPNNNELLLKLTSFLSDGMYIMSNIIHNITQYNSNIIDYYNERREKTIIPTTNESVEKAFWDNIEQYQSTLLNIELQDSIINEFKNIQSYCKENILNIDQTELLDDSKTIQIIFLLSIVVIAVILGVKSLSNRDKIEEESSFKKEDYFDDIEDSE